MNKWVAQDTLTGWIVEVVWINPQGLARTVHTYTSRTWYTTVDHSAVVHEFRDVVPVGQLAYLN